MSSQPAVARLGYRPALDGLRGAAVLLVLLRHLGSIDIVGAGAVGVGAFFTLSGFLITTLMLEEWADTGTVSLRAFFRRRFLRLLPALAAVLLVVVAYALATGRMAELIGPVAAAGAYVMNYARIAGLDHSFLAHTWTLALEEHFYLLWPVTLLLLGRHLQRRTVAITTIGLAAASALWRMLLWLQGAEALRLQYATDTRLDSMLIGCAAALIFLGRRPAVPQWAGWAAVVTLGWLSVLGPQSAFMLTIGYTLLPLAAIVLVLHLMRGGGPLAEAAGWGPVVALGRISYGVYLWHYALWGMMRPFLPKDMPEPLHSFVLVASVLLVATLSYRVIEQPFLRLKRPAPKPTTVSDERVPATVP